MLELLVSSPARRRLLELLWGEGVSGSASEFAELADVGVTSAYRELKAMERYHVVTASRRGRKEVYVANSDHPAAMALKTLVRPGGLSPVEDDPILRGKLHSVGVPLPAEPVPVPSDELEDVLVKGVQLSHRDAVLARLLPLSFWQQRNSLDPDRLLTVAKRLGEKQAVGFFLDLTHVLAGDSRFAEWAKLFQDRRWRAHHDFFATRSSTGSRALAEANTPAVARQWGYRMNMNLDAFDSAFAKFKRATA
jgi:DNA-binding transcriptional ArsR family regulator